MVRFPIVAPAPSAAKWEAFLRSNPQAHLLQTSAWGDLKARHGWKAMRVIEQGAGAQILLRRLFPGACLAYLPRGPIGPWTGTLPALIETARSSGAFALLIEPDLDDPNAEQLPALGFVPAVRGVQPKTSLIVDLSGSEETILARMHQKTRYNIGLARRRGVEVRSWDDPSSFAAMLRSTGDRQGFGVHSAAYYQDAYRLFFPRGECALLAAEREGARLAALMVFASGQGAWYLYGASLLHGREHMAPYLLQWEAIRWARSRGARWYDLWGIPDRPEVDLEAEFSSRSDGLWGVYRFKRGFGGRWAQTVGAWEMPLRPCLYRLYRLLGSRHAV